MDLIHYSFMPLILFLLLYTLNLLLLHLSFSNGTEGVAFFFYLSYFSTFCIEPIKLHNNKIIDVLYIIKYYYTGIVCSIALRMGFMHMFTCRKLAVMHTNNQRLTNLYGSVILHIQHLLILFLSPLILRWVVSVGSALECTVYWESYRKKTFTNHLHWRTLRENIQGITNSLSAR